MKLKIKFILFVLIIHAATFILAYQLWYQDEMIFFFIELLILVSLILAWSLYKDLLAPLNLMLRGRDAIADKDFNIKFVKTGKYEMDQLIDIYNTMIDQLRVERTHQQEQHFFLDKLINTSPVGIIVMDFDGLISSANPKALKMLNYNEKEIAQKSIEDIQHPVFQSAKDLKDNDSTTVFVNGFNTYKVQRSHFIDRGFHRYFIIIEELTNEIIATEKKVYGKVIRIMAHEVNNTIGPVNSILSTAMSDPVLWKDQQSSALRNAFEIALERNHNLAAFVRKFADIIKLPSPVKEKININDVLLNTAELLRGKAEIKQIQFITRLDKPFYIQADKIQMEQVLINIIKNAIEAAVNRGSVYLISSYSTQCIYIKDSGNALEQLSHEQLFSPFFTTKKEGEGIGLALVKEILMNHDFKFRLYTTDDQLTCFEMCFHEQ